MEDKIKKVVNNLKLNKMNGYYVKNDEELFILLNELIEDKMIVGTGDSYTLEQLKVYEYLRNRDINFLDKYQVNLNKEEKRKIYIDNFSTDVFITGTNAITLSGEIINIDGNGSRVAPMIYGPKRVILIVGVNKICEDINSAYLRVRQVAAPLDAKRLDKKTPCTILNECVDCKHKDRICNDFVMITSQFDQDRIHVIIYNEKLGF